MIKGFQLLGKYNSVSSSLSCLKSAENMVREVWAERGPAFWSHLQVGGGITKAGSTHRAGCFKDGHSALSLPRAEGSAGEELRG